ncbi:MAG TPA: hypothetical protein VJV23_16505 [Candidatus Polarisedimenticolia bacterium]|nr:hypothetical protein [Candidatus Polarisedimenticolia bacterium]
MERVRKIFLCSLGAVAVAAAFWGCNGSDIDDPDFSDSVLIVEGVTPASVQADVTPTTDPNTMLSQPPQDDTVKVEVRNLNRTQSSSGIFGDVQITSLDLTCSDPTLGTIVNSTGVPASLSIPAESTGTIEVLVFSGAFKMANSGALLGINSLCGIRFHGQDLAGEPILSQEAVFGVNFVDTP